MGTGEEEDQSQQVSLVDEMKTKSSKLMLLGLVLVGEVMGTVSPEDDAFRKRVQLRVETNNRVFKRTPAQSSRNINPTTYRCRLTPIKTSSGKLQWGSTSSIAPPKKLHPYVLSSFYYSVHIARNFSSFHRIIQ